MRCQELLQSPAALEPAAAADQMTHVEHAGTLHVEIIQHHTHNARDAGEVDVADGGVTVPCEHGIDGLGELGAGCLVDAACVDPDPVVAIGDCYVGASSNLAESLKLARPLGPLYVLERDLLVAPCVRQDGIRWRFDEKLPQSRLFGLNESHYVGFGGRARKTEWNWA